MSDLTTYLHLFTKLFIDYLPECISASLKLQTDAKSCIVYSDQETEVSATKLAQNKVMVSLTIGEDTKNVILKPQDYGLVEFPVKDEFLRNQKVWEKFDAAFKYGLKDVPGTDPFDEASDIRGARSDDTPLREDTLRSQGLPRGVPDRHPLPLDIPDRHPLPLDIPDRSRPLPPDMPKFEDEYEILQQPGRPSMSAPYGTNDLYPNGQKYPDFRPVPGFGPGSGGGMVFDPQAEFQRQQEQDLRSKGVPPGAKYDDPFSRDTGNDYNNPFGNRRGPGGPGGPGAFGGFI